MNEVVAAAWFEEAVGNVRRTAKASACSPLDTVEALREVFESEREAERQRLTIGQLKAAVDLAIERGIDPLTSVVIDLQDRPEHDWFFHLAADVHDPAHPDNNEAYMWFTLTPTVAADCRFSYGHHQDEEVGA